MVSFQLLVKYPQFPGFFYSLREWSSITRRGRLQNEMGWQVMFNPTKKEGGAGCISLSCIDG